jgi:actin-related protein 2
MVGDEAASLRRALEVTYPIENGVIRNWNDMELIWSYLFENKMKINTTDKKVLLTGKTAWRTTKAVWRP